MVVLVALGSNLGDPSARIREAFDRLESLSAVPIVRSSHWSSTPVDCPPGSPMFVNAAARLEARPGDTPGSMLAALQSIERGFGRRPKQVVNEARPLDLDLIAWGGERVATAELTVPHPRAHLRRFVLVPLSEIAPDFILPGQEATIRELAAGLESGGEVRRL